MKVVKPDDEIDNDQRFTALQSQINELKSLLLLNESDSLNKTQKRWARPNSNRRPSPCKDGGLVPVVAFSDAEPEGDTTTRKANVPSCTV
jgi:hypothetical protein